MITWGPKIETGYKNEPQLFDVTSAVPCECENAAQENPAMVEYFSTLLENIRKKDYADSMTPMKQ